MTQRILIMGLPGSGKTEFAAGLSATLFLTVKFTWFNADAIRERYNDWDFSLEGRIRQAHRMRELSDKEILQGRLAICDFVAPLQEMRDIYDADIIVWMDTLKQSQYEDTNKLFEQPKMYDYRITDWNQSDDIINKITERVIKFTQAV